ncbi:MAG TPA: hypothetical protein VE967_07875 [Gemmatimonadaceae bacterium]|nr:hypothetical protein [Gemmatimonadaceae bacterium]
MPKKLFITATVVAALVRPVHAQTSGAHSVTAARAAALAWLRQQGRIADTARVAADSADLWRRFVTCRNKATHSGCALVGKGPVTLVEVRLKGDTKATVSYSVPSFRTTSCRLGRPLPQPMLTATTWTTFEISFADGRWGGMHELGVLAC